jgi:hypothetical protein
MLDADGLEIAGVAGIARTVRGVYGMVLYCMYHPSLLPLGFYPSLPCPRTRGMGDREDVYIYVL